MSDTEAKISIVADASKVAPGAQEAKAKLSEIGEQARALNGQFSSLAEFLKQAFQVSVAQSAALKQEVASLAPTLSAIETKLGEMTSALGVGFATLAAQMTGFGSQTQTVTQQASAGAEALRQDIATVSPVVMAVTTSMSELGATVRSSFSASATASDELLKALVAGFETAAAKTTASTQEIVSAIGKVETELKAAAAASSTLGDRLVEVLRRPAPAAEETGQSIGKLEARTQALIKVIDPVAAEQAKWNAFLREAKALLDAGAISTEQFAHAQQVAEKALKDGGVSAGQMKFAMRDLSYNISDVSTSLAGGINPMMIFAQQGNQIVGAIALMKGESSGFVSFLAGPWGSVIMGAIGLIGVMATKHSEAAGKTGDLKGASLELSDALLKEKFGTEAAMKALQDYNAEQEKARKNDAIAIQTTLAKAQSRMTEAIATRQQIQAEIDRQRAASGTMMSTMGMSANPALAASSAELERQKKKIAEDQAFITNKTTEIARINAKALADPLEGIKLKYDQIRAGIERVAEKTHLGVAATSAWLAEANKQQAAEEDAARKTKSGNTAELDATAALATADTAAERARAQLTLTRIKAREELKAGTITAERYLARVSAAEGAVQAATTKKPKKAPSRMGEWEASLEEQKVALAEMADAQGSFRQMSVQEEAAYWNAIRQRSDLSHEEQVGADKKYFALRQQMRRDDFDAHIATLNREIDAAKGNAADQIRIATQIADDIKSKYGERSKEYEQAQARIVQIAHRAAEEEMRIAEQVEQFHRRLEDQRFRDQMQGIQFKTDLGLQSPKQEVQAMVAAENARWSKEAISLSASVQAASGNDEATNRALLAQRQAYQQHQNTLTQIARQGVMARTLVERQAIGSIAQSWGQNIGRMLTLQQGFGATVQGLWQGLVGAVGNAIGQMLEQWIAMQLTKLIIGGATEKATAAGTISAEAAKAGAGGTASMAAAPFPLNLGAPAFGASMAAAAASYAALVAVPSAEGGWWEVPGGGAGIDGKGGQLGIVHPREMVLPAGLATPLRDMVAGGGAAPASPANDRGSAKSDFHYHDHSGRLTPADIMANRAAVAKAMKQAHREGAFVGTGISF